MKRNILFLIIFTIFISACKGDLRKKSELEQNKVAVEESEKSDVNDKEINNTKEEYNKAYVEDFEFAFNILKTYYPFFEVNKILNDVDFLSMHDEFLSWIKDCKDDDEFFNTMDEILSYVNNGHTNMIPYEEGNFFYNLYREIPEHHMSWISKLYEKENVKNRYDIKKESLDQPIEEEESHASVGDYVDGKVAYIKIYSMASDREKDEKMISDYLKKIKNYQALIIDIQGNPGGDSTYWADFLMPKIIKSELRRVSYSFMKSGDIMEDYYNSPDYIKLTDKTVDELNFPKRTSNIIKNFDKYAVYEDVVTPVDDSIKFDGNIYMLVDEGVYSSSEAFASFAKATGFATLVGTRTGGDGLGSDPFQIDLPNTGFVMRFPKELGTTEDGIINELDKTEPDILVNGISNINERSKEKVLELEGINK